MKFGLDDVTIEQLSKVFERNPKVDKALIFGSRAKGNYREDSDIDIALKGNNITLTDVLQLSSSLEDTGVAYKIDLVAYDSIKEPALVEHINRMGIEFYSSWQEWRFSDFVTINPTVSLKGNETYSFVEMKDLQDGKRFCFPSASRKPSSGARFKERDTLFARITPCLENGKICQVKGLENGIGFGSTKFLVFRGKENVSNNDFVFYLSRWNEVREFAESHFEGTSGRQRVSKDCFEELVLELPDIEEQTAIAATLSYLDDKIDLLHRQNKTLEGLAETLFRQWFVEEAGEGCKQGELSDVLDLVYGKALKEEIRTGEGYPVVGSSGIVGFHSHYLVEGPGIVIGRKGTLGSVNYLFESFHPIDTTYFVKSKVESAGLFYEYFLLKTLNFGEMNSDLAVPGLNRDIALATEIEVPGNSRLHEFNEYCGQLFQKIKSNTRQINSLVGLRDTLLPKLMSGEVRVNN